ncbi:hypothetical protein EBZ80_04885 [bacterium]|nr:hypothetical protein [bacterium]
MTTTALLKRRLRRLDQEEHEPVGLVWEGNSCYMDSVLFALLAAPSAFVQRRFFGATDPEPLVRDVREALLSVAVRIRASEEWFRGARILRRALRPHRDALRAYPDFCGSGQQEALEFLQLILSVFGLNGQKRIGAVVRYSKRYGVFTRSRKNVVWNDIVLERTDRRASIIFEIPCRVLRRGRTIACLRYTESSYDLVDTRYRGCLVNCSEELVAVEHFADLAVIVARREDPYGAVSADRLTIPTTLTDPHGKTLRLEAVVVRAGESDLAGHYLCFRRLRDDSWCRFDDLEDEIEFFPDWKTVRTRHPEVHTHGILYFYAV